MRPAQAPPPARRARTTSRARHEDGTQIPDWADQQRTHSPNAPTSLLVNPKLRLSQIQLKIGDESLNATARLGRQEIMTDGS